MNMYYDFLKNYFKPLGKLKDSVPFMITWSIGSSVVGVLILIIFTTFFMSAPGIVKIMPFFFGFNAAMAGFSLIDKTSDRISHKRIYAVCSGLVTVLLALLLVSFILDISMLIGWFHIILYCLAGLGGGYLGGWLAVKSHNLKNKQKISGLQSDVTEKGYVSRR